MIQDLKNKNMIPDLIQTYLHTGEGYNPFFIKDNWQVAQLNYVDPQDLYGIKKMDMHQHTDEVFVLTAGRAILIAAHLLADNFSFECINMDIGTTYNIPINTWHNIAMDKDASLIIVEKNNTHITDCIYKPLNEAEQNKLNAIIKNKLNSIQ